METDYEPLKGKALILFGMLLRDMDVRDVLRKMKRGRKEKGGEFDLESIPALSEATEEIQDFLVYTLFYLLQEEE